MKAKLIIVFVFSVFLFGCSTENKTSVVTEKYQTARNEEDNVDSPAFWKGNNGEEWLISTAKTTHLLLIDDAKDGKNIKRFGSKGTKLGQFNRPNGIAVIDSLLFVVERDNKRVQVFTLPSLKSIGTFGDSLLIKPYGIYISKKENLYEVFVTDNYEFEKDVIPADSLLNKRVHKYSVAVSNGELYAKLAAYIGETTGIGVLRVVESIHGDSLNDILLVAEEDTTRSSIKIYNLEGRFLEKEFGNNIIKGQIEGIALFEDNNGAGFWIITDQSHSENIFHVFDRKTFEHMAEFAGAKTTNTDGIWLTKKPFTNFPDGAFFAVHNDGNVSAFDLREIKKILTNKLLEK